MSKVKCLKCEEEGHDSEVHFLKNHLDLAHDGMTLQEYLEEFPKAKIASDEVWEIFNKEAPTRVGTQKFENIVRVGSIEMEATDGEVEYTFARPNCYTYPKQGDAASAIERMARSVKYGRSTFIYGAAGTGKSSSIRALAHDLNREASHYPMRDGLDPELYLGKEAVVVDEASGQSITQFQEGKLLKDLKGRIGKDGVRRGVVILIDDFDRAVAQYHEVFRHILEDNAQNVFIPELGVNVNVHPDTIIIATANSNGRGDNTGYYASVEEMDESILDRFDRAIEYHFLEEEEEKEILRKKFPYVADVADPEVFDIAMAVAGDIRAMIKANEIFASFSHRRLVQWMQSVEELLRENDDTYYRGVMREASQDFLDWFDTHVREAVVDRVVTNHCPN